MQKCMGALHTTAIDLSAARLHVCRMHRRHFLLGSGAFSVACAAGPTIPPASPAEPARSPARGVAAICFDLFTLFDPRSVVGVAESFAPGSGASLCETWRTRQFQYSWLRAAGGRYEDFEAVTRAALVYASRAHDLRLSETAFGQLVAAYSELEPWPDTREQLEGFRSRGLRMAPLANYSPSMLSRLITRAKLSGYFDMLISTDAARTFKPDPRAYALGPQRLGLPRERIVFSAFGGWDAAGATWFGFPTFWVNRLGVTAETLEPAPQGTGANLGELSRFVYERVG